MLKNRIGKMSRLSLWGMLLILFLSFSFLVHAKENIFSLPNALVLEQPKEENPLRKYKFNAYTFLGVLSHGGSNLLVIKTPENEIFVIGKNSVLGKEGVIVRKILIDKITIEYCGKVEEVKLFEEK